MSDPDWLYIEEKIAEHKKNIEELRLFILSSIHCLSENAFFEIFHDLENIEKIIIKNYIENKKYDTNIGIGWTPKLSLWSKLCNFFSH